MKKSDIAAQVAARTGLSRTEAAANTVIAPATSSPTPK